jgi:hypothetical protein
MNNQKRYRLVKWIITLTMLGGMLGGLMTAGYILFLVIKILTKAAY